MLRLDAALCVTLFYLARFPCECLNFVIHGFSTAVYDESLKDSLFSGRLISQCLALALQYQVATLLYIIISIPITVHHVRSVDLFQIVAVSSVVKFKCSLAY